MITSRFLDWRIVNLFQPTVNSSSQMAINYEDQSPLILWVEKGGVGQQATTESLRQKERALTSPKTSALAFISVLPWRINDAGILRLWTVV